MEGKGQYVTAAVIVGLVGVVGFFALRSPVFPNVTASIDATETTTVDQMRGTRKKLVLALVIPGDPVSAQAVELLKAQHAAHEANAAFAALVFGDPSVAESFRTTRDLPYAVYSLNPQSNPVQYNELVKTVGGWRSRFYGGTVVLLDANRKVTAQVDGIEFEHLGDLIKKL
jgi:hypothetical protein